MSEPADPAPTPWQINSTSILDANGRLVCVLAGRLMQEPQIAAQIATAPELYDMLQAVEGWMQTQREPAFLDEIRCVLDRASAND